MQNSGFTLEYVKRKTRRTESSFQETLVRVLKARLTKETAFFAMRDAGTRMTQEIAALMGHGVMAGVPDLIFIHRGRAFGLELKTKNSHLSDQQRAAQVTLRDAGMRVEVASSLNEALMHLRDMGIPLSARNEDIFRRERAA